MDFSIIEGLTDEELKELYDDNVKKNFDEVYIGGCWCFNTIGGVTSFGPHGWVGAYFHIAPFGAEYCSIQLLTERSCDDWCVSKEGINGARGYFLGFDENCQCSKPYGHSTWYQCKR